MSEPKIIRNFIRFEDYNLSLIKGFNIIEFVGDHIIAIFREDGKLDLIVVDCGKQIMEMDISFKKNHKNYKIFDTYIELKEISKNILNIILYITLEENQKPFLYNIDVFVFISDELMFKVLKFNSEFVGNYIFTKIYEKSDDIKLIPDLEIDEVYGEKLLFHDKKHAVVLYHSKNAMIVYYADNRI